MHKPIHMNDRYTGLCYKISEPGLGRTKRLRLRRRACRIIALSFLRQDSKELYHHFMRCARKVR
ncbi:hypothetical protein JXVLWARM_CDS_0082 [Burkholderia phage Bm1]